MSGFHWSRYQSECETKQNLVRTHRDKADRAQLFGIPLTDYSRDELLAALVFMAERQMIYDWRPETKLPVQHHP